jgi:RNA polymerase sigma factor (TIGR02999 family)
MSDALPVTALLAAWTQGDRSALGELVPLVYADLRRIAARRLRSEKRSHTLSATALVHECYMRLVDQTSARWQNRAQFFAIASEQMRRILVDHARKRHAVKRDGGVQITLDDGVASAAARNLDLLALDGALDELMALDPRAARVVEMRFFGGLSIEEAAFALGLSSATVEREWVTARAWLFQRLQTPPRPA